MRSSDLLAPIGALALSLLAAGLVATGALPMGAELPLKIGGAVLVVVLGGVGLRLGTQAGRAPAWFNLVLGLALAGAAVWSIPSATRTLMILRDPGSVKGFDLTQGGLPSDAAGVVRVRGHLRPDLHLDEYQVEPGALPNQNERAPAQLVPLLGELGEDKEGPVVTQGSVVVARVPGDPSRKVSDEPVELIGELRPLPPGVFDALFAVSTEVDATKIDAVMLDTVALPPVERAWTTLAIDFGAAVLGALLLFGATVRRQE